MVHTADDLARGDNTPDLVPDQIGNTYGADWALQVADSLPLHDGQDRTVVVSSLPVACTVHGSGIGTVHGAAVGAGIGIGAPESVGEGDLASSLDIPCCPLAAGD